MKLIGSFTEKRYRSALIGEHEALFDEQENAPLLTILKEIMPQMRTAYFLYFIPEQGEIFYTLLIDMDIIVDIVVNWPEEDLLLEPVKIQSVKNYKKGLSNDRHDKRMNK